MHIPTYLHKCIQFSKLIEIFIIKQSEILKLTISGWSSAMCLYVNGRLNCFLLIYYFRNHNDNTINPSK